MRDLLADFCCRRSVGGIRTSLYNAVTLDQVQVLVGFMRMFMQKEQEIAKYAD